MTKRKTGRQLEDEYLRTYYKWLRVMRWDANYHHYPAEIPTYNEPRMNRFVANLGHKGKKKGFSDIVILEQKQGYGALFIELKTETGRASMEQLAFLSNCNNNGYLGVVAFGLDAAVEITKWYMGESKEPLPVTKRTRTAEGIKFDVLEVGK